MGSSKCDDGPSIRANLLDVGKGSLGNVTVSSSKCDWMVSTRIGTHVGRGDMIESDFVGRFGFGKVNVSSSKSDWSIRTPTVDASGHKSAALSGLEARFTPGGTIGVASSKCDWSIRSNPFDAETVAGSLVSDFKGRLGRNRVTLSSSKCDWSIQVLGDRVRARRPPTFRSSVSSSKCDFTLNMDFGLHEGPRYRVRAVGSDKCDFRVIDFDYLGDRRKPWQSLLTKERGNKR